MALEETTSGLLRNFVADPDWLAHRLLLSAGEIEYCRISCAQRDAIPFLTDDYLLGSEARRRYPLRAVVAAAPARAVRLILHSGFCASTLLSQALTATGLISSLSEPVLLNDVVGYRRRGDLQDAEAVGYITDALHLLSTGPQHPARVVKASCVVNPMAAGLLNAVPDARAVALEAPLETFLISVARKATPGRAWARELLAGLREDGAETFGLDARAFFGLTDMQCAALAWLIQARLFDAWEAAFGERILRLSSESLLADPSDAIVRVLAHFGISVAPGTAVTDRKIWTRHSKDHRPFDPARRDEEYGRAREAHGEEIAPVLGWIEAVRSMAEAQGPS